MNYRDFVIERFCELWWQPWFVCSVVFMKKLNSRTIQIDWLKWISLFQNPNNVVFHSHSLYSNCRTSNGSDINMYSMPFALFSASTSLVEHLIRSQCKELAQEWICAAAAALLLRTPNCIIWVISRTLRALNIEKEFSVECRSYNRLICCYCYKFLLIETRMIQSIANFASQMKSTKSTSHCIYSVHKKKLRRYFYVQINVSDVVRKYQSRWLIVEKLIEFYSYEPHV